MSIVTSVQPFVFDSSSRKLLEALEALQPGSVSHDVLYYIDKLRQAVDGLDEIDERIAELQKSRAHMAGMVELYILKLAKASEESEEV